MAINLRPVETTEKVSFNWEYTTPSWVVQWNSVQEWIDLHFTSISPVVSVSLSPNNYLREYWDSITNPTITANITEWANPTSSITNVEIFRGTLAWTKIYEWTDISYQDIYTVESYQRYSVRITDWEWRQDDSYSSYSFTYPMFWWVANDWEIYDGINETDLESIISKQITTKWTKSFTSSPDGERYVFAYPNSYWNLSSIIDANWFETIWDYDIFTYDVNNMLDWTTQSYTFYILKNNTTQTNFKNTYYF